LEAHTGRLVWRFRGAPHDRRINLYGHLASNWPVNTGITAHDGTVYFAAGLRDYAGVHVYALNARTGTIVWQNNRAGSCFIPDQRRGITPGGYGLIIDDKFWLKAHRQGRNGIFSTSDGTLEPLPTSPNLGDMGGPNNDGRDLCMLDDSHVIFGGSWVHTDKEDRAFSNRKRTFAVHALDANGSPLYPMVHIPENSLCAPAWDGQDIFMFVQSPGRRRAWLEKWSKARMIATIDSARTDAANANKTEAQLTWCEWNTDPTALCEWRTGFTYLRGVALTPNAVAILCTHMDNPNHGPTWGNPSTWEWRLCLLNRTNGDTLANVELPSHPVRGGIAVNREGDVIVALQSGAILCYGEGTVHVAGSTPAPQPPTPSMADTDIGASGWETTEERAPRTAGTASVTPASTAEPDRNTPAAATTGPQAPVLGTTPVAQVPEEQAESHTPACRTSPEMYAKSHPDEPVEQPVVETHDMRWLCDLPCITVVKARAAQSDAGVTIDADLRTRWSPSSEEDAWALYDLGDVYEVSGITLAWYAQRTAEAGATVELSQDGEVFTKADHATLEGRASNETLRTFLPQAARYIRLELAPSENGDYPSIYEIGIHESRTKEARASE